jgi:Na+(H+)/acetate symporter ActP
MSAYWKIPLQALVLVIGVLVFVFYLFTPPPMLFNDAHLSQVRGSPRALEYAALEQRFANAIEQRRQAAEQLAGLRESGNAMALSFANAGFASWNEEVTSVRREAVALVKDVSGDASYNDVNFVFPTWVTTHLPIGLVGLLLAAIFAAAMSTISAELASLSTTTIIDFYRRWARPDANDRHLLLVSRVATGFWGLFASIVAIWSVELGSLIEVVNRFGSFFYGSILGVFLLAIGWPRANGHGAFIGLLAGMTAVALVEIYTDIEFLWLNIVGAAAVFIVGVLVSAVTPDRARA